MIEGNEPFLQLLFTGFKSRQAVDCVLSLRNRDNIFKEVVQWAGLKKLFSGVP
jgi:hypothetical protein